MSSINNIIEHLQQLAVDIDSVSTDPSNARTGHDIEGIAASLRKYGQRKPIVVNSRNNIILAGNGTYQAAKSIGWTQIAAVMTDDDDLVATGFAIADNRLADKSFFDTKVLKDLLNSFPEDDKDIPGIDDAFLQSLYGEEVDDPKNEWKELPEFHQEDVQPKYTIKVHLHTLDDLKDFAKLVQQDITEKTKYIYYPKEETNDLKALEYSIE